MTSSIVLLDGPIGTQLSCRGVAVDLPSWSARAINTAPEILSQIHRDYADAGAVVHTANTFRTRHRTVGNNWRELTAKAVEIARHSVPIGHRIAGSLAPIFDCYRPDLSPSHPRNEHAEMAIELASAGCDLVLCETFPHVGEAIVAVDESVKTGLETWVAFTAGPNADLLSPYEMAEGARCAVDAGAATVLVNCTSAAQTTPFVKSLAGAKLNVPIGAYANAGPAEDCLGFANVSEHGIKQYCDFALQWIELGATLIGGCCGTGPMHIRAIRDRLLRN
ncbi:Homocysteine S-methyltransferase [Planctomycetes bacterium CA13]|uniref:Homocysteine S-methyltransferase n=1 Tax=Novipirellula herctigrandis TaxID=2527986 RepID=A0A5C5Z676_9BACT|nr:Homocysteine S-methyltransferase [Planctomycetes bacterium CA13]